MHTNTKFIKRNSMIEQTKLWIIQDYNNEHIIQLEGEYIPVKDGKDDIIMQVADKFYARSWEDDSWVELVTIHIKTLNNDRIFEQF